MNSNPLAILCTSHSPALWQSQAPESHKGESRSAPSGQLDFQTMDTPKITAAEKSKAGRSRNRTEEPGYDDEAM